jgi:hypothetical protein
MTKDNLLKRILHIPGVTSALLMEDSETISILATVHGGSRDEINVVLYDHTPAYVRTHLVHHPIALPWWRRLLVWLGL